MKALEEIIRLLDGQTRVAEAINRYYGLSGKDEVTQQRVWWWLNKCDGRVPAEFCIGLEHAVSGAITREQMRPDVFVGRPLESIEYQPQAGAA